MPLPRQLTLEQLITRWAAILDPFIDKAFLKGIVLKDQVLAVGNNLVNHRLGRLPQGYVITDINAAASIYRYDVFTDLILPLNSSAICTVDLYVF